MEAKLVIGLPNGKVYKTTIETSLLAGKKIGDKIDGSILNLPNCELLITGGTDNAGFPMRPDIVGTGRKKLLVGRSIGARVKGKGQKVRKTFRGNIIADDIAQINMKLIKGEIKLPEEVKPAEEKSKEKQEEKESKEGKTKEEAKEKTPKEAEKAVSQEKSETKES